MESDSSTVASGVISLSELYAFVRKHFKNEEALRMERTQLSKHYSKICDGIIAPIPDTEGFYLWGSYDDKGFWQNIYLGTARYGASKSLRKRIRGS